jgi:hypothetical protein
MTGEIRYHSRLAPPAKGILQAEQFSLFCRVHQFEPVKKKPCPFDH